MSPRWGSDSAIHKSLLQSAQSVSSAIIRDSDELSPVKFYGYDVLPHSMRLQTASTLCG